MIDGETDDDYTTLGMNRRGMWDAVEIRELVSSIAPTTGLICLRYSNIAFNDMEALSGWARSTLRSLS